MAGSGGGKQKGAPAAVPQPSGRRRASVPTSVRRGERVAPGETRQRLEKPSMNSTGSTAAWLSSASDELLALIEPAERGEGA